MCVREELRSRRGPAVSVRGEAAPSGWSSPRQSAAEELRAGPTPPGAEALLQQVLVHVAAFLTSTMLLTLY